MNDRSDTGGPNRLDLNIALREASVDFIDGELLLLDGACGIAVTLGADLVDAIWQVLPTGGRRERLARIAVRSDADFDRFVAGVDRARQASA